VTWSGNDGGRKQELEFFSCSILFFVWCILYVFHPMYIHRDPMQRMVFDWDLMSDCI
jgi:hypothetical protein